MKRKKLPTGIYTFAKIRGEDYYYVDKTPFALQLIEEGSYYFLSRPRRFGKSLFLDTLAELFQANEPLFRGLYAHEHWDWGIKYPVIRLSFGGGLMRDRAQLEAKFRELLDINQARLGISCRQPTAPGCFAELIQSAEQKYGQRVVILVDEYDKPIVDNLTQPELAREMRDGLRNFYSVIKDNDAQIKFAFITGVSKFSKVSIFSGLNNLEDITLNVGYSAICGYTEDDLDEVFAPELEGLDRQQIRDWYNGYNWTGEAVYNPYDLLLLFDSRLFRCYWFETGTPTFLIDVLTQRQTFSPKISAWHATEALLSRFDVDDMTTEALLWQTGYLTLHGQRQVGTARVEYRLGYPNLEVESALNEALLSRLYGNASLASESVSRLYDTLMSGDFEQLRQHFHSLYAGIPHDWYRNNPITHYEGYWASVFYSHFAALGLDIRLEDATNQGRLDMAVLFNQQVYLFEFKVVELVPEGKALGQLKIKNYAEKYQALNQPIHLIGIEFSKEQRNLSGFDVETLTQQVLI
ncbi:ATP-binding protein [Magnetovirga frankeli]|uniref:ATP-binding protein n=1 Tax=Magnetovirga frankeli TaxID=947516 RepID=UPI0012937B0A|nr:ATP-binding protein [gamma proteobacterium SS-5]